MFSTISFVLACLLFAPFSLQSPAVASTNSATAVSVDNINSNVVSADGGFSPDPSMFGFNAALYQLQSLYPTITDANVQADIQNQINAVSAMNSIGGLQNQIRNLQAITAYVKDAKMRAALAAQVTALQGFYTLFNAQNGEMHRAMADSAVDDSAKNMIAEQIMELEGPANTNVERRGYYGGHGYYGGRGYWGHGGWGHGGWGHGGYGGWGRGWSGRGRGGYW